MIVQRLRVLDRALHQRALDLRVRLEIQDQRVVCERLDRALVLELHEAAARVVDEMIIAVDLLRLDDERLDVAHRADLGIAVQLLASLELRDRQSTRSVRPILPRNVATGSRLCTVMLLAM